MTDRCYLVSCEHGGNFVPAPYKKLFEGNEKVLETHRGYDLGVHSVAHLLAEQLRSPVQVAELTRLLVDLNRSPHSRRLLSEFSLRLTVEERLELLQHYYYPYRLALKRKAYDLIKACGQVVHLSVHSFTPVFSGRLRNADIGLLYDPARSREKAFCKQWQRALAEAAPELKVRRNYPYQGISDSVVKTFRSHFAPHQYLGIELEINQRFFQDAAFHWALVRDALMGTLKSL